ncbi:MAG: TlpA disulfide reductase family protein [Chloroflexota bacterium]|nr:TlpA disulfide reductase family protein [Chloroflexota bacterium]MDE2651142.1 TlpA disulfide reductase family protein [Chloroflexota bacterium]
MTRLPIRIWLAHWLAALLCFGLALAIILRAGLPERVESTGDLPQQVAPAVGHPAPIFRLPDVSGEAVTLTQGDAAFTLLYFWSTGCAPCRQEMPALGGLQTSQPLRILAVNMGENANLVRDWVDQLGLSYTVLLDPALAVARAYHIRGLPSAFLLAADYRIVAVYYGPVRIQQLRRDMAGYARHG